MFQQQDLNSIPRVHYNDGKKRLSFQKPIAGHESSRRDSDDGWVLVEDYTNTNPSSPKHRFTEEDARLLHQVQATNQELNQAKATKRREIMSSQNPNGSSAAQQLQLNRLANSQIETELEMLGQPNDQRRLAIQRASRASFQRKQKAYKGQNSRNTQKSNNRSSRQKGGMKQPIHGKARR